MKGDYDITGTWSEIIKVLSKFRGGRVLLPVQGSEFWAVVSRKEARAFLDYHAGADGFRAEVKGGDLYLELIWGKQ